MIKQELNMMSRTKGYSAEVSNQFDHNSSFALRQMQAPVNEPDVSLSWDTSPHLYGVGS